MKRKIYFSKKTFSIFRHDQLIFFSFTFFSFVELTMEGAELDQLFEQKAAEIREWHPDNEPSQDEKLVLRASVLFFHVWCFIVCFSSLFFLVESLWFVQASNNW